MFVDACAIVSILSGEADASDYAEALAKAEQPITSALAAWEAIVVLSRAEKFNRPVREIETFVFEWLDGNQIKLAGAPSGERQLLQHALEALDAFGKGPNRLNVADCFHYAYAKSAGVPILTNDRLLRATDIPTAP